MPDRSSPSPPWAQQGGGWSAGTVTGLRGVPAPPPVETDEPPPVDPATRQRRQLMLFGGAAVTVLVVGVVTMLALVLTGSGPFEPRASGPPDSRPPLAKLCPPPSAAPEQQPPAAPPPPVSGQRTVDAETGISYTAYGEPWQPWQTVWRAGTLEVPYKVGQHFVTETYSGGSYHASILSAGVPATDNDALVLNLECVGRQVAADVRAEYYPQPTRMESIRDERTTLGGRPAWVTVFRLHFTSPGLRATDELAAVACIDVGRTTAAVLYVSIPGTHRQFDWVVEDVLKSVRTT
jgi:hypothetical protein